MIKKIFRGVFDTFLAAALIASVIAGSAILSLEVKASSLYRQSRVLSMLLRQEPVGVAGLLRDTRNIDMAVSFAGALAAAYINFELIPLGEAATFAAVFESLPVNVDVTDFEYSRGSLHITGKADSEGYNAFLQGLRAREYFSSVTGAPPGDGDATGSFEIICAVYDP